MPKILLLEEDDIEAKHIGNTLKECGYQVLLIADHRMLEQQVKSYRPELVILDSDNRHTNETLTEFEENPVLKEIPILLLTSDIYSPLPKLISRKSLKYLPKPFHPQILDLQIQTTLHEIWCQMELRSLQQKVTEYRQKFEHLTVIDEVTSLFNQSYMYNSLKVEFARAVRYNKSLSLVLLEVKDFKRICERFGPAGGDFILRETGRLIKELIRVMDIAGRSGEGRITLILPETDAASTAVVVEKIKQQIGSYKFICPAPAKPDAAAEKGNTPIPVDLRSGTAYYPAKDIERFDMLMEAAELALSLDREKRHLA